MSQGFECHLCRQQTLVGEKHVELLLTRLTDGEVVPGQKLLRMCGSCGKRLAKGEPLGELEHAVFQAENSSEMDKPEYAFVTAGARAVWMMCCRVELSLGMAGPGAEKVAQQLCRAIKDRAVNNFR